MTENIGGKTRNSLYWSLSLKIPYEFFRFATSIIVARILEPKDFGIVSIATMAIYYSNSFTNFGFNQALVQRKEITEKHINSVFTFDLIVSVFMTVIVFLLSGHIAAFFNSPESKNVIRVLSFVFILTTLHDLPYILLRRNINFKVISIVDMTRDVAMSIITLGLAYLGFKYWSIVWGHLIPLFFAMLYLLHKVGSPLRLSYHHASIKELSNFSIWSFIQLQVYFLSSRIDRIIIGKFINPTMLGVYEKSKSLSQMPSESLGDKVNTVLFSSFSRTQDSKEDIKNLFNKGLMILSALNFPIYFGLYAVAQHFVIVLLGEKWSQMIVPFQIMAFAGVFASINGLLSALAVGAGYFKSYTLRFAASTCVFFIGSIFVVNNGIEAIAAVMVLYTFILFFLTYTLVKNAFELKWWSFIMCVSPAFFESAIMVIDIELCKLFFFGSINIFNLFALVSIGGFIYIAIMMIIPSSNLNTVRGPIYRDLHKVLSKIKEMRTP